MYDNHAIYFPPDELASVLLPVTTGCWYNKCAYCSMYKDDDYSEISLWDIEKELLNGPPYTEKVFLTGADPLWVGFDKLRKILALIRQYLPYCACVASYASVRSVSKYTVEELALLHNEGLRLLYIGFETGRDEALRVMRKGHTAVQAVEQARKLNAARLPFNTIVMYGIAGEGNGEANAAATADMINQFKTNRVITMNLTIFYGTELSKMVERGEFVPPNSKERLVEIRTLLEKLETTERMIFDTTHPTNIIKIKGTLPEDRVRLIREVERYISKRMVFV
ncbi:radical SAM protein [Acidaminobacter hydrogenoformans]|nr:radical SAM protein [Acidaminobacter hydrogenoformans]